MLASAAAQSAPLDIPPQPNRQPWQFWLNRPTSGPTNFVTSWRPPNVLNGNPTRSTATMPAPTLQTAATLTVATPVPTSTGTTPAVIAPRPSGWQAPLFTVGGLTVTTATAAAVTAVLVLVVVLGKRRR